MGSRTPRTTPRFGGSLTQELVESATRLQKEFIDRLIQRTARAGVAGGLAPYPTPPSVDLEVADPTVFEAPFGTLFHIGPPEENSVLIRWAGPSDHGFRGQVTVYLSDLLQFEAAAQESIPTSGATSATQELGRQIAALAERLHIRRAGREVTHNPGWQDRELAEMFGEDSFAPLYLANYGTNFVVFEDANAVSIQFAHASTFGNEALVPLSDIHAFALHLWVDSSPPAPGAGSCDSGN
jgi:hypothetical protein